MQKNKEHALIVGLLILLCFCIAIALMSGRYAVSLEKVIGILMHQVVGGVETWSHIDKTVIMTIRLPRILLAILVGSGLAVSGVSMQALFSNPLVSPHILGVSYGAGFGAALGILISGNSLSIQGCAIAFGLLAIVITCWISKTQNGIQLYMLVLSGVIVGAVFQAFISLIKYVADPEEKLPTIVYWLMGSLSGTGIRDIYIALPLIGGSIAVLYLIRWKLNVLSLNEEEAISMGIQLPLLRGIVIFTTTIITAVSVSLCGIIGFVGLVIPHLSRMIAGSEHSRLVPITIIIGGIYLLVIDTLSRTLIAAEIPISILTAVVGAPFFAFLLRKTGGK